MQWTPGNNADGHYFYEDDLPPIVAMEPEMEVCRVDWDVPHTYQVSGFNGTNGSEGPISDLLTVVWAVPEPSPIPTMTPTPEPTPAPISTLKPRGKSGKTRRNQH